MLGRRTNPPVVGHVQHYDSLQELHRTQWENWGPWQEVALSGWVGVDTEKLFVIFEEI